MIFEFPSNILLQRYKMGKILSCYMICWGVVVLCIGFGKQECDLVSIAMLIVQLKISRTSSFSEDCKVSSNVASHQGSSWWSAAGTKPESMLRGLSCFNLPMLASASYQAWHSMVSASMVKKIQIPNLGDG